MLRLFDADEDIDPQYFIAVEQQILMECKDIINALSLSLCFQVLYKILNLTRNTC